MDYKNRIIEEAAVLFRIYGIKAVTMDMLANQMGISKRTIYEVFKDKDELLTGVLKLMAGKQKVVMQKILDESENVIEAVFKMLDLMIDHFQNMSPAFQLDMKRYHNEVVLKLKEKNETPYFRANLEIVQRGIKEEVFRDDIDVEIINKCMFEVIKMSNDNEIFPPDDFFRKDVIRNVYVNYLRGISTPKGVELIDSYLKKV